MSERGWSHRDLVAFAVSRGGVCISESYVGATVRHRWRCGRDHEFEATPVLLIDAGYWCPTCFPSVDDTSGWDYDLHVEIDPLLRRFHR